MEIRVLFIRCVFFCLLFIQKGFAQYIVNGSARKISCNCYTLTEEINRSSGSVWNSNKINLNKSFDFWFKVFLGCKDSAGADGIAFVMQPNNTSVGISGGGLGFGGVQPSIGIALDTWQNEDRNDPAYDHISIQANGDVNHRHDLAGPVLASASSDNIEDCQWHVLRIVWDADAKNLVTYFDGVLRLQKQIDLVSSIFKGDSLVYWGFTGSTGGWFNLQQFCTALDPKFSIGGPVNGGCVSRPIQFRDLSESFAPISFYSWNFGDGAGSTDREPMHTFSAPGAYPVNLQITGLDGCKNEANITVNVGTEPNGMVVVNDTCFGFLPMVLLNGNNKAVSYLWSLDGKVVSRDQRPILKQMDEGNHQLDVVITSLYGCGMPAKAGKAFAIKPKPEVEADGVDGCVQESIRFKALQTDKKTTVKSWHWNFGDGSGSVVQGPIHAYKEATQYAVKLWAEATDGCTSDTVTKKVLVNAAVAFGGKDTTVIKDFPFQLRGSGNGSFLWSPATGVSDPTISDPIVSLSQDQEFVLTVTTAEGCTAKDTVSIKVFNGPAIYVPSAFTPNGDGKNEVLKPVYVGIKELKQFAVFNRWGQMVFTTTNMQKGWEGKNAGAGTYVWLIRAVNSLNQPLTIKGTVTIIR